MLANKVKVHRAQTIYSSKINMNARGSAKQLCTYSRTLLPLPSMQQVFTGHTSMHLSFITRRGTPRPPNLGDVITTARRSGLSLAGQMRKATGYLEHPAG